MSESNSRKFSKGEIGQLITGDVDFTSATVRGHIIPDTNDTYDIGSAEYKVRDMYVSDNSLWVGDDVKIGASGGKKKNKKRKTGKTPKKIYDAMIGVGKLFATEADLKIKFKTDIHDQDPDPTLDPDHANFHPPIRKWLEFSAINGQGGFKRPDDIFDDDDDFDSEDGVDAVEGLQAALDAKLNASLAYALPTATDSILGGVKVGNNLTISNGVLSGVNSYTLPTASSTVLGGIKVGANLSISSGVLAGAAPYSKPSAEPISYITGLQGALDAKTTPGYVDTQVAALVDSAPGTLDTLNELAEALGDDANFSTTVTNSIATKLSLSGGTMTGHTYFGDGKKLHFGASNDLAVYHDGTHSYVQDQGTGDLRLMGTQIHLRSGNGESYIYCTQDSEVHLYHDNTYRIKTTANGVTVNGTCTATAFSGDGSSLTNLPAAGATDLNGLSDVTVSTSNPTISSNKPVGHVWVNKSTGAVYVCTDAATNDNRWSNSGDGTGSITSWSGSGGSENTYSIGGNNYKSHTFTSSGTFTATGSSSKVIDVMVVAGGGAGGNWHSGGGGAGGMITHSPTVSGGSYSIVIGSGGSGGLSSVGTSGSNSSAFGASTVGGGHGSSYEYQAGSSGGSGAGGAGTTHSYGYGTSGVSGQGNNGGNGLHYHGGGGGGGKGGVGGNASAGSVAGDGGVGGANNYKTGSNIYYAGGGGGGSWQGSSSTTGQGGNGGGGTGSYNANSGQPTPGTDGLGGGGGGGGHQGNSVPASWAPTMNGGDGVVIIRYTI